MTTVPIVCDAVSIVVLRQTAEGWQTLLLLRAHPPLSWSQPGGRIEPGESAAAAARREMVEETGIQPTALYHVDYNEMFYEPERERISLLPVFVAIVAANAVATLSNEHHDQRWLSLDAARALVAFTGQRAMLDHIEREFIQRPIPEAQRLD
ncbi:MAG: NUDIX domain-containing protein [Pseudomonadota bacterium]